MRVHVLGLADIPVQRQTPCCAFTWKVYHLCKMLKMRGHHVILYGCAGSDASIADEFVETVPEELVKNAHPGVNWSRNQIMNDNRGPAYDEFHRRTRYEVMRRADYGKFEPVCATIGWIEPSCRNLQDNQCVIESGIGYKYSFAKYRVFESYTCMHYIWGLQQKGETVQQFPLDVVIPNYFDPDMFTADLPRKPYALFMGRVNEDKGWKLALAACNKVGITLKVVGQLWPGQEKDVIGEIVRRGGEYEEAASIEHRKQLMGECRAFFCPTQYCEDFGGVAVEAQMSGAPIITSDWGGFCDTVLHGVTGFRCHSIDDMVTGLILADRIDSRVCRKWAVDNFSLERVSHMYDEYLHRVGEHFIGKPWPGWRQNIFWNAKNYPSSVPAIRRIAGSAAPSLGSLLTAHGSDKDRGHGYGGYYEALLASDRDKMRAMLEVGIGTMNPQAHSNMCCAGGPGYKPGASLRAWRDWLPNATIYGMDVAPDTMFSGEDRIETILCDSANGVAVRNALSGRGLSFDLIVDDGAHQVEPQVQTFVNLAPFLNAGGRYVIEDIEDRNALVARLATELARMGWYAQVLTLETNMAVIVRPHGALPQGHPIEKIGFFYQVYRQHKAAEFVLANVRKVYPNAPVAMVSDGGDDFAELAQRFGASYRMGEQTGNGFNVRFPTAAQAKTWLLRLADGLKDIAKRGAEWAMLLEDDVWVRGAILAPPTAFGGTEGAEWDHPHVAEIATVREYIKGQRLGVDLGRYAGCGGTLLQIAACEPAIRHFANGRDFAAIFNGLPQLSWSDILLSTALCLAAIPYSATGCHGNPVADMDRPWVTVLHGYKEYYQ